MRRARTGKSEAGSAPTKESGSGVFGAGGGPGFMEYKQSRGKDTIVTKTMETGIGSAKDTVNQLSRATTTSPNGRAAQATSSTIKKTANTYRRARGNTDVGKKV